MYKIYLTNFTYLNATLQLKVFNLTIVVNFTFTIADLVKDFTFRLCLDMIKLMQAECELIVTLYCRE